MVPGVITLEAMVAAAGRLLRQTHPETARWRLAGVRSVRFRKPVPPGGELAIEVTATADPGGFLAVATLDGRTAVEAEFDLRRC